MSKQCYLKQFSTQISSFWPIDRTLSGATTPGQIGHGNNGTGGIHQIPQSSGIIGASLSECLVSYLGHSLEKSYPSAEMQLLYSTAPADWANNSSDTAIVGKKIIDHSFCRS